MAGRHAQKSSNKPLVILIIVAVVIVAAIIAGVIFLMNGGIDRLTGQTATVAATTAAATETPAETTAAAPETTAAGAGEEETTAEAPAPAAEEETGVPADDTAIDVVVPTDPGVEVTYFNGTFIPNGRVEDADSGSAATLREVFGSGYSEGVLTFNSDGTFSDTLVSDGANRGAYVVQDKTIHATYTNDRNMRIEVTEWDDGAPVAFHINYNGYVVYFG